MPEEYQSLYRRFRPGCFGDVLGQDHVTRALQGAVKSGRIGHAYLFSGPRGTGKTSTARIFAKALNCLEPADGEPCNGCVSCRSITDGSSLDVHELDAASNNGVEAMRDLVARSALATPGNWKVYIIDEVHMLSTAASNALLKTLEEPPARVIFVLATTDPQKVLPTIRSRTQHFEFHLLSSEIIESLVSQVASRADIDLDAHVVGSVVRKARGSARDALSALDQAASGGTVDDFSPGPLVGAIIESDTRGVLVELAGAINQGIEPQVIATSLLERMRNGFLGTFAPELVELEASELTQVISESKRLGLVSLVRAMEVLGKVLVDMRSAVDPRISLEVALARLTQSDLDTSLDSIVQRLERLEGDGTRPGNSNQTTGAQIPSRSPGPESVSRATNPPVVTSGGPIAPGPGGGSSGQPVSESGKTSREKPYTARSPQSRPTVAPYQARGDLSAAQALTMRYGTANALGSNPENTRDKVEPPTKSYPSRDEITKAWGNVVLRSLTQKARLAFQEGRFLDSEPGTALVALPSKGVIERAHEHVDEVIKALSSHFGVRLEVVVTLDATEVKSLSSSLVEDEADLVTSPDEYLDEEQAKARAHEIFMRDFPGATLVEG